MMDKRQISQEFDPSSVQIGHRDKYVWILAYAHLMKVMGDPYFLCPFPGTALIFLGAAFQMVTHAKRAEAIIIIKTGT